MPTSTPRSFFPHALGLGAAALLAAACAQPKDASVSSAAAAPTEAPPAVLSAAASGAPSGGPSAAPAASAVAPSPSAGPASSGSSAVAFETCAPGWSSGSIRTLRNYPRRAIGDLPANNTPNGHFDTEGTVKAAYACPPCPPKAVCKPCAEPWVDLVDGAGPALRVLVNSGAELPVGKRFRVSVATCAGASPPRYELRGYVPAS